MVKIAVDAGHGLHTLGKRTPAGEREWTFNNKVVKALINKLNQYEGVQVLRLDDPTGRVDVELLTRTNKANRWGADALVSVHHNADKGFWADHGGTETYTQFNSSRASVDIAKLIHKEIVAAMGLDDRGLKTANFSMTRNSNMPAVLTEGGFMDSREDIIAMRDDSKMIKQGESIANALANYFKLTPKKNASVSKPAPANPAKPTANKSINEIAKEVLAGKWGNGATRESRLKAAGYNADAVQAEVNKILSPTPAKPKLKSVNEIAKEVLAGKWGNGATRESRLKSAGYNAYAVQAEVNKILTPAPAKPKLKSVNEIAKEVLAGEWGNGSTRESKLKAAGYNANSVQDAVNKLAGQPSQPSKSYKDVAKEVIYGRWGNGKDRENRLKKAGYNPALVQKEVNKLM